jgi:hypothetical protein
VKENELRGGGTDRFSIEPRGKGEGEGEQGPGTAWRHTKEQGGGSCGARARARGGWQPTAARKRSALAAVGVLE